MDLPISVCIGGEAGNGIMSAGAAIAKVAVRSGYQVCDYSEYPSIIRGGHNVTYIAINEKSARSPIEQIDCLIALNQDTIDRHSGQLKEDSSVIYDIEKGQKVDDKLKVNAVGVPINRIAQQIGGSNLMRNTVAVAAALKVLGADLNMFYELLKEEFGAKPEVAEKNIEVAKAAVSHLETNYPNVGKGYLEKKENVETKIVVSGNQAIALGAMAAGVQFVSIYPMTPTSSLIETMAPLQDKYNFVYRQPEDELAAINLAVGAAFAGARSLTASAGGGFNLMSEAYGLAAITETPLVIVVGQRGGPATGLPTYTEQADLRFILHASQGEFARIVLAAGDVDEAYELTAKAFDLADIYQTPVIVLVDKHLCECHWSTVPFAPVEKIIRGKLKLEASENYQRFALSEDGISARSFPGVGNHILANSDEHNEAGLSNDEAANRISQMQKRLKKLEVCAQNHMEGPKLYGNSDAPITIVSWGSNKGAILDALEMFGNANYLHITWMSPFPDKQVKEILNKAKYLLGIEGNLTAQLMGLIREQTGIEILDRMLKSDGRPFGACEIVSKLKEIEIF